MHLYVLSYAACSLGVLNNLIGPSVNDIIVKLGILKYKLGRIKHSFHCKLFQFFCAIRVNVHVKVHEKTIKEEQRQKGIEVKGALKYKETDVRQSLRVLYC